MEERTGDAFEFGEQLTVVGKKLQAGDPAPDFTLDYVDPGDGTAGQVRLANSRPHPPAQRRQLARYPRLPRRNPPVGKLRHELPPAVRLYTISMDLPYAQARWHTAENVSHQSLSAHKSEQFGQDYGVLIKEWRLLQRAVFVIDRDGTVVYADYVPDQMQEPDYGKAVAAAREAAL